MQQQKREDAADFREEAQVRAGRTVESEDEAEQVAERVRAPSERAEALAEKADDVDPDGNLAGVRRVRLEHEPDSGRLRRSDF